MYKYIFPFVQLRFSIVEIHFPICTIIFLHFQKYILKFKHKLIAITSLLYQCLHPLPYLHTFAPANHIPVTKVSDVMGWEIYSCGIPQWVIMEKGWRQPWKRTEWSWWCRWRLKMETTKTFSPTPPCPRLLHQQVQGWAAPRLTYSGCFEALNCCDDF